MYINFPWATLPYDETNDYENNWLQILINVNQVIKQTYINEVFILPMPCITLNRSVWDNVHRASVYYTKPI